MKNLLHFIPSRDVACNVSTKGKLLNRIWEKFFALPRLLFIGMCFSLVIAYPLYASNGANLTRTNSYAIGILICSTLGLSTYLFWVIFQPEKF